MEEIVRRVLVGLLHLARSGLSQKVDGGVLAGKCLAFHEFAPSCNRQEAGREVPRRAASCQLSASRRLMGRISRIYRIKTTREACVILILHPSSSRQSPAALAR